MSERLYSHTNVKQTIDGDCCSSKQAIHVWGNDALLVELPQKHGERITGVAGGHIRATKSGNQEAAPAFQKAPRG